MRQKKNTRIKYKKNDKKWKIKFRLKVSCAGYGY